MKNIPLILKPKISTVLALIVSSSFFCIICLILLKNLKNAEGSYDIAAILLISSFSIFGMLGIYSLLNLKTYILEKDKLVIKRPLLFYHKEVYLSSIVSVKQGRYDVNSSHNGQNIEIHKGLQTKLILKNGGSIKINTFESSNYPKFIEQLSRRLEFKNDFPNSHSGKKEFNFQKIVLFSILLIGLTFFFIYALVRY